MPMLLAFAVTLLAVAAYLVGELMTQPSMERRRAVRRAAEYGRIRTAVQGFDRARFHERVVAPAAAGLARVVLRLNPRLTMEVIASRLVAAGLGGSVSATGFLAAKGVAAVVGGFLGLLLGGLLGGATNAVLVALALAAGGFIAPGFALGVRTRKRRDTVRAQLPDALDLLAVSVEAGLGFDGAVDKLTEHMDGALAEEFRLTISEIRIGEARHDALKKLAERCGTPEVASFTRAIIQADQLGISLGRILRVQAADARIKRQAAAEEKAMKSPIKMLFPTVLFIFPALFIVILGPAFLNLAKVF
jgi:tight adherence protein C